MHLAPNCGCLCIESLISHTLPYFLVDQKARQSLFLVISCNLSVFTIPAGTALLAVRWPYRIYS